MNEKNLRENDKLANAVLNSVLDAIITINEQGIIQVFNPGAQKIFGYFPYEVIGKNVSMLMPDPYQQNHNQYIANYLRTGERKIIGIGREAQGKRKDGTIFPLEIAITEIRLQKQRSFVGVIRDITEKKLAQTKLDEMVMQLEQSNDNMLAVLNQLRIGIIMINDKGRITFISSMCQSFMDKSLNLILGSFWYKVCPFTREGKKELFSILKNKNNSDHKVPIEFNTPDGHHYYVEVEVLDDPRNSDSKIFFIYDMSEIHDLRLQLEKKARFQNMIGKSKPMRNLFRQIQDLSKVDSTVLIQGETGTGKELIARAIHNSSKRQNSPFIAVNCAGFTESLISSQLFGHKKGAFTGAAQDQTGVFESANKGTLFLDEIGDIPISVQTSLLRVIQEKEITRLGENIPRKIDVRLIFATNHDLKKNVENGKFRKDLFYRIQVAAIFPPPLRHRRGDIPLLVNFFLDRFRASLGKDILKAGDDVINIFMSYEWPGNVRELQNIIESAVIKCKGKELGYQDIPGYMIDKKAHFSLNIKKSKNEKLKQQIFEALSKTDGNCSAAARLMGISRATFYRHMKRLGISRT